MKNQKFIFQTFLSLSIALVLLNNNLLSQCPITAVIPSPTSIGSGAEGYVYINPGNPNEALTADLDESNSVSQINVYNTINIGGTWSQIATLTENGNGAADPSVIIDALTGIYYVAYLEANRWGVYVSKSSNWSNPIPIYTGNQIYAADKPFLWIDNGNSFYSGRLYCSWSDLTGQILDGIRIKYSTNGGNSWSQTPYHIYDISDINLRENGSVIQTGSNGNVYVAWAEDYVDPQNNSLFYWQNIYINVSTNGGVDWVYSANSPYVAVDQNHIGIAEMHSTGVGPSMVLDNHNNIFLFWSSKINNAYTVNYVKGTYSNGSGFSFGSVTTIQQLSTIYNYIYPWASYDPISNRIACIYRTTRVDPSSCTSSCQAGTGISISCDGIANWVTPYQENVNYSVQTSVPDDYIGISYYNNVCIGVWSEGTNDNFSSYSHELKTASPYQISPLIVSDSQIVMIPDSTHFVFTGTGTYLKIDSGAVILLGNGSTIEFYNGAYLCANNATFTSLNSNSPWDGIYLSSSNGDDTITNCTIVNAVNGINVIDKNTININSQPSTQITGCSFIDSSSTALNYGIYCSNSANVLIRNNTFSSSSVAEGFASAITMLYCSSGDLDILDNTINNCTNGISIVQSSPYIERNAIYGQQNDGTGIVLDNCNGALKYNTINYFYKAVETYYSSAYLYRNNFNYSAYDLVDLYKSSSPVLKPITSSGTLMWLGGNNNFNGNINAPSQYGIGLNDVSFPALDSGFNNVVLNGANYMSGNLSGDTLFAAYNYWQDRPPNYNKFAITAGTVIDTPDYDGSSLPLTSGYELTDIGFGLYDTVYTSGGNNPGADNLYTQAYSDEASKNYADAINLYKQFVSTYKTSNLAPAAISRIINCMEKKLGTSKDYSDIQNYMIQIRNNNDIPYTVREIAEDLIIKSMVRQNIYPNSISDYDTMYVHNQSNHKGTHALINKLSLLSFYQDSSGNHMTRNSTNQYKLSLLSLLIGKQILPSHVSNNPVLPKEFKLYQNYPNPFNPSTKIKYDIPKNSNVTIKIYDLLGKEIYSFSEYKTPGTYELQFDGSKYASGVYFYRIQARQVGSSTSDFIAVKKMVLVK